MAAIASGAATSAATANSLAATAKTEAEAAQTTADDNARSIVQKVLYFTSPLTTPFYQNCSVNLNINGEIDVNSTKVIDTNQNIICNNITSAGEISQTHTNATMVIQKTANNGLSYIGHSNLHNNKVTTIYKANNDNITAVSDAVIQVTGNNFNDANNQGNFSITANTTKIVNNTYKNYFQFVNEAANLLTMNWKANTENLLCTYDAQITVVGSTTTTNDGNGIMNITNANTNIISSLVNICKKTYSFFHFQNIDANLISMKLKANSLNITNTTDATISVLGLGNTSGDNSGIMNIYAGGLNVTPSRTGESFFNFQNPETNLLTMNFKANETNTDNTIDSSITCSGIATTINNTGTLAFVTQTTNISQAPTQNYVGYPTQAYSFIQCVNNFSNSLSLLFKSNNNNNLNLYDASIIVTPIVGNNLSANNHGKMDLQADVIRIGTHKSVVGSGSSVIMIGDKNSEVIILGRLTLSNIIDGKATYFSQIIRDRAP